jgi:hypothetical protein
VFVQCILYEFISLEHNKTSFDLCSTSGGDIYYLFSICCLRMKYKMKKSQWKRKIWTWNVKSHVIYESGLLTLCCSHANVHVDHRDLLPAGQEQVLLILVPHIDSRVNIIDNERPGASTHIILKFNVMICIYFVLIWTLALCNLCNIY